MQVRLNTYNPNFGTLKIYKSRETRDTIDNVVINRDIEVAKALKNVRDRIDKASDDVPVTLWGRNGYLKLTSVKYKRRNSHCFLKTDEIKPEMKADKKIEILNEFARAFEAFMGKSEDPIDKTIQEIYS